GHLLPHPKDPRDPKRRRAAALHNGPLLSGRFVCISQVRRAEPDRQDVTPSARHYAGAARLAAPTEEEPMSGVRVLVGTRKGAFILTADGKRQKWSVSGPLFSGWEIFHMKGSP